MPWLIFAYRSRLGAALWSQGVISCTVAVANVIEQELCPVQSYTVAAYRLVGHAYNHLHVYMGPERASMAAAAHYEEPLVPIVSSCQRRFLPDFDARARGAAFAAADAGCARGVGSPLVSHS
jgi:hypothetical protein